MIARRVVVASAVTTAIGLGVAGAYALTRPGDSGSSSESKAVHHSACVPSGAQPEGGLPKGTYTYTGELSPGADADVPGGTAGASLSFATSITVSVDDPEVNSAGQDWQQGTISSDLRLTATGKVEVGRAGIGVERFRGRSVTYGFAEPAYMMAYTDFTHPPNALDPRSIPVGGTVTMDHDTYGGWGLDVSYKLGLGYEKTSKDGLSTAITRLRGNKVQVAVGPKDTTEKAISLGYGTDEVNISLIDDSTVSRLFMRQAVFDLDDTAGRDGYYRMVFAGRIPERVGGGVISLARVGGTEAAKDAGFQAKLGESTFGSINKWGHSSHLITNYSDGRQSEALTYREFNNTMVDETEYSVLGGSGPLLPRTSYQLRLRDVGGKDLQAYNSGYANRRGVVIDGDQNMVLKLTPADLETIREQSLEILANGIRSDRYGGWNQYREFKDNHVTPADVRNWIARMRANGGHEQDKLEAIQIAGDIKPYWVYIAPSDAAILGDIFRGPARSPRNSLLWLREWADAFAAASGKDPVGVGDAVCVGSASGPVERPVAKVRSCQEENIPGVRPPAVKIPETVRLPDSTFAPRGSAVDATIGNDSHPYFVIGQQGATCHVGRSGDGGDFLDVAPPDGRSGIVATLFAGGAINSEIHGCQYIDRIRPIIAAADAQDNTSNYSACINRPKSVQVRQLATRTHGFYAALVYLPRGTQDPEWSVYGSSGKPRMPHGSTTYLYVSTVRTDHGERSINGQSIACSLPDSQDGICAASLGYFLVQTGGDAGMRSTVQKQLTNSVQTWVRQHPY